MMLMNGSVNDSNVRWSRRRQQQSKKNEKERIPFSFLIVVTILLVSILLESPRHVTAFSSSNSGFIHQQASTWHTLPVTPKRSHQQRENYRYPQNYQSKSFVESAPLWSATTDDNPSFSISNITSSFSALWTSNNKDVDNSKEEDDSQWWLWSYIPSLPVPSLDEFWPFTTTKIEFPNIDELQSEAIQKLQETQQKYLQSHQIVKKRRVFQRLVEITIILSGQILRPVLCSLVQTKPDFTKIHIPTDEDWDIFWKTKRGKLSNAERVAQGIPALGPTFVKLGQIMATRPDILPVPLAEALGDLQYNVTPFDDITARRMIRTDMKTALIRQKQKRKHDDNNPSNYYIQSKNDIKQFMNTLSTKPIAAGGIAQVYKGYIPKFGYVAVKVLRPGVRRKVERDATLFHSMATWVESISNNTMKLPVVRNLDIDVGSLKLVEAVDEFTARVLEDMDFIRETENMKSFGQLYDIRIGTSHTVKIMVPKVISDLSSNRIIVMEWLEGTKLTDVCSDCDERIQIEKENLDLIVKAIEMTVSQMIDYGLLHGDPHLGNLLRVENPKTGKPELGYLDYGLVSYVPQKFRDAIVCGVTQLVFARNVEAVADICGEVGLLPEEKLIDPIERKRFLDAFQDTLDEILIWPKNPRGLSTEVPKVRFENLLPAVSKLIRSFEFTIPPYFLNNIRALATLEGVALKLDPNFNVLRVIYPYSINRLMRNPTVSHRVQQTFLDICRSPDTKLISPRRVRMLLNDWALWTGYRKRKIFWDLMTSAGYRRVSKVIFKNWVLNRVRNMKNLASYCQRLVIAARQRLVNVFSRKRLVVRRSGQVQYTST